MATNYYFRAKRAKSHLPDYFKPEPLDDHDPDSEFDIKEDDVRKRSRPKGFRHEESLDDESEPQQEEEDFCEIDNLPKGKDQLLKLLEKVKEKEFYYRQAYFKEQAEQINKPSFVSDLAIPICADIRTFDFDNLIARQKQFGHGLFDVIMMDPPWRLSSSQPSRGVAIQYESLGDQVIMDMPIQKLSKDGFIFIWAINAKYRVALNLMEKWGYKPVDQIVWVKKTVKGKIAKGHGFYLQHAKESCLVGVKGNVQHNKRFKSNVACDVIFSQRRGQSQKPTQIYEYIQSLCPSGFYLQIFGRRNNLRGKWVTIGNEI